jgi:hypothetical protein
MNTPDTTPFGDMLAFYGASEWIWRYMEICAKEGILYSDPTTFIMARPVDSSVDIEILNTLQDVENQGLTDAWYILYASGNLSHFLDKAPFHLPKIMWQRNGKGPAKIHLLTTLQQQRRIYG